MNYIERIGSRGATATMGLCISLVALTSACDSSLVREAKQAEDDGEVISNEIMTAMYPQSFQPGFPQYLERDFEAGADFICDEIQFEYQRDICSEPQINWRP
jgi:hypothetical protein